MPPVSSPRLLASLAVAAVCAFSLLAISPQPAPAEDMRYNATNPFIWDNDSESDAFALDFVMALAHTGSLKLIGISESPHPWKSTSENYQAIVEKARNSGWHNIPDASWDLGGYYMTALSRPPDGSIDSTAPLATAPARMIMDKVLSVGTSSQPVVVGTGGALTTVASAYLLANQAGRGAEFASKMVLYAGIGADGTHVLNGYNESQDEWAVYVCQQRLKVVFTEYTNADHNQPKFWAMIDALPDNEIGDYMKTTKANWPYAPYQGVGDEMPVLTLLNPRQGGYFNSTERVTFDHWDSAAWSWGAPGPNNINWNAYPAYLNLRSEPSADDIAVWRLNAEDDFITGTFTHAFASASAGGGGGGAAAPPPGRAAPRNPRGAELRLRLTPRSAVRRRGGRVAYRLRVSAPRRRLSRVRVCVRTGRGMRIIRAPSARLRGRRGCWRIRRLARGHTRTLRARTRISTRYTGHRITVGASARAAGTGTARVRARVRISR